MECREVAEGVRDGEGWERCPLVRSRVQGDAEEVGLDSETDRVIVISTRMRGTGAVDSRSLDQRGVGENDRRHEWESAARVKESHCTTEHD